MVFPQTNTNSHTLTLNSADQSSVHLRMLCKYFDPATLFGPAEPVPGYFRLFRYLPTAFRHQFRTGTDPFRPFSRADGKTCVPCRVNFVGVMASFCSAFHAARCPSNVTVCVAVFAPVLTPSARINFPLRSICCCSSATCNRWNGSQLRSISQILEDNIPELLPRTTSQLLLEKFYTRSLSLSLFAVNTR